jgi:hypothetical protein
MDYQLNLKSLLLEKIVLDYLKSESDHSNYFVLDPENEPWKPSK